MGKRESMPTPPSTIGGRINRLFEVQRPSREPERTWTNREVVHACKSRGFDLSESHLSELRREVKTNPTVRTLSAIAQFFEVRVGYFTDDEIASEIERDLVAREAELHERIAAGRAAEDDFQAARAELQAAMRKAGASKVAHRHADAASTKETASMMRALAEALNDNGDDGERR